MKDYFYHRLISVIYWQGNSFLEKELAHTQVGCGQQFFLLQIIDNPGISALDLAKQGRLDKATVTRAIKKLIANGYILGEEDERDRRIRHLYATEKAYGVLEAIRQTRAKWNTILTEGISSEEMEQVDRLLKKMAENAYLYKDTESGSVNKDE